MHCSKQTKYIVLGVLFVISMGLIIFGVYKLGKGKKVKHFDTEYCYALDLTPSKRFATKTPYDFDKNISFPQPAIKSNCKPIQLWTIIRHGVRLPGTGEIPSLKNDLPRIKQEILENSKTKTAGMKLCEADLMNIKNWKLDPIVDKTTAYHLASSGAQQTADLADRFRKEYPTLFELPFSEENYIVHSRRLRCIADSKNIFLDRIFNASISSKRNVNSSAEWFRDDIKGKFNITSDEPIKFTSAPEVEEMLQEINEKLGYTANRGLNWTSVKLLYDMCRYDNAWHLGELSPWCAVFSSKHKDLLEFYEDLYSFYEYGYGNDHRITMGCSAVKTMMHYFEKVASNEPNQPKAILIFTHHGIIETFLTCCNAHEDGILLTADNNKLSKDRQWKTTDDCPFSAHITATFYTCEVETEKYVQFILNEEPLELDFPGCKNGLCPWQSVIDHLKPIADDCVRV